MCRTVRVKNHLKTSGRHKPNQFLGQEDPVLSGREHFSDLSDFSNQANEVEPDFFVDRSKTAVFVPDAEGQDKSTALDSRVYDYEMEVESVLQVLVGRTLEQSRIEVVEEYEQ